MAQLATLQTWMREVITDPDGVVAGARTDRARAQFATPPERFDEVVTASKALTAQQRLEIYQHGYFRRLLDCLGELLPVLRHALGDDLFTRFALDYLDEHPSRSYTLARLDDGFVAYLRDTRPDRDRPVGEREDWPDFIIDLAELEHAIRVTFDGPGVEGAPLLDAADVAGWSDDELLAARPVVVPCLALRTFRFPVREYLLAVRRGDDPPLPAPRTTHIAFNRRDFQVRLLELEPAPYRMLAALADGSAVAAAASGAGLSGPASIRTWLRRLAEAGLFRSPTDHTDQSDHTDPTDETDETDVRDGDASRGAHP